VAAEPEASAQITTKSAATHDLQPVSCTTYLTNFLPVIMPASFLSSKWLLRKRFPHTRTHTHFLLSTFLASNKKCHYSCKARGLQAYTDTVSAVVFSCLRNSVVMYRGRPLPALRHCTMYTNWLSSIYFIVSCPSSGVRWGFFLKASTEIVALYMMHFLLNDSYSDIIIIIQINNLSQSAASTAK
jgi:hypothetical protein